VHITVQNCSRQQSNEYFLIIFPFILQTVITAQMLSTGEHICKKTFYVLYSWHVFTFYFYLLYLKKLQKCISEGLMHVAASMVSPEPPDQSLPNSWNKSPLARHLTLPNFVALRQEVCEIYHENLYSRKSGPTFTKIAYGPMPNFIALVQTVYEFFTPSLFWRRMGTPGPTVTNLRPDVRLHQSSKFLTTRLRDKQSSICDNTPCYWL